MPAPMPSITASQERPVTRVKPLNTSASKNRDPPPELNWATRNSLRYLPNTPPAPSFNGVPKLARWTWARPVAASSVTRKPIQRRDSTRT